MRKLVLVAVLLVFCRPVFAKEDETGFRVVEERTDNSVTLTMESDYCVEFTVTLEATLKNMTPSQPVPLTVDAAGRSSFVLARFQITDRTQSWRYNYKYYWEYGGRRDSTTNDADYAMPFPPGRYLVLQSPRGSYSHHAGSGSENAVDWDVPEGTVVCAGVEASLWKCATIPQSADPIRNLSRSGIT
jgi:hypothetical protein